jgi:hypothetical protein
MLDYIKLTTGKTAFYSPYFIFIRDESLIFFIDLLERYGIDIEVKSGREKSRENPHEFYVSIEGEWIAVMDNWFYSLFHLNRRLAFVDELGISKDVFQCVVGDSDYSFGFKYYKDGIIRRDYYVANPSYRKGDLVLKANLGEPLIGERTYLRSNGGYEKVLNIAFEQGISLSKNMKKIRAYKYSTRRITTNKAYK